MGSINNKRQSIMIACAALCLGQIAGANLVVAQGAGAQNFGGSAVTSLTEATGYLTTHNSTTGHSATGHSTMGHAPSPYNGAYNTGPIEATAGAQGAAVLVLGVYGPNTSAVCQAGSSGVAYYNCQQLVSYDLYRGTGVNNSDSQTTLGNDGRVALQPTGSFYGARGYRKKLRGESSSYCQHQSLYGGESTCSVSGGASYKTGASARIYFKRSGN